MGKILMNCYIFDENVNEDCLKSQLLFKNMNNWEMNFCQIGQHFSYQKSMLGCTNVAIAGNSWTKRFHTTVSTTINFGQL